jgi:ribose transport system ATP-binding protein
VNAAKSAATATGSGALLRCVDIHKSFGGVPVLEGISLELEPGTVTALAGDNGAG